MSTVRAAAALWMLLWLGGCSGRPVLGALTPKDEVEFAKARLDEIRTSRFDALSRHLGPELSTPEAAQKLATLAGYFPKGEPRSVELVGSHVGKGPGSWTANLSFQYEFEGAWMVAVVVLHREDGGALLVRGVHLQRIRDSLQRLNAFTIENKGGLHSAFLVAIALVLGLVVAAFVACLRTPDLPRRWLWALFTLVGVGGLTLDWTTGQVGFRPISVHLLGAGAVRASPHAPWLFTVSFPLGAVLFLVKRARLRRSPPAPGPESPLEGPGSAPPSPPGGAQTPQA